MPLTAPARPPGYADDPRPPGALPAWLPWQPPPLPYRNEPELLDAPGEATEHELRESLHDIRMANVVGRGTAVALAHLPDVLGDWPAGKPLRVLDLATGSGDIPRAILRWARRRGIPCTVVAADISPEVIAETRRHTRGNAAIHLVVCDATRPPFPPESFDLVTLNLALHHLDVTSARLTLGQMARLARHGFIVNDVERSWPALIASIILVYGITRNRLTRNDGPASVRRAFTRTEIRRLAGEAGVHGGRLVQHAFWRIAFVGRKAPRDAAEGADARAL